MAMTKTLAVLSAHWRIHRPDAPALAAWGVAADEDEDWQERAAVLEFEGGLPREEAEAQAKREMAGAQP